MQTYIKVWQPFQMFSPVLRSESNKADNVPGIRAIWINKWWFLYSNIEHRIEFGWNRLAGSTMLLLLEVSSIEQNPFGISFLWLFFANICHLLVSRIAPCLMLVYGSAHSSFWSRKVRVAAVVDCKSMPRRQSLCMVCRRISNILYVHRNEKWKQAARGESSYPRP